MTAASVKERSACCFAKSEPKSDGHGGLKDVCKNCGKDFVVAGANGNGAGAPAAARAADTGKKCPVEGCPGHVDGAGGCACCKRRAEWAAANLPSRSCELCGGTIEKGKRCPPCAKLYTKSQMLTKKAEKK